MSLAARADRLLEVVDDRAGVDPGLPLLEAPDREAVLHLATDVRRRLASVADRSTMSEDRLRVLVEAETDQALAASADGAGAAIRGAVLDELLGFGALQDLLDDSRISEVMVNGTQNVYVEVSGVIHRTDRTFESEEALLRVIDRMVRSSGRRVDQASPMVDARLPDGSRLNVILPPLAVDGPAVTIRKFSADRLSIEALVDSGSLTSEVAAYLTSAVESRRNVIVSGGTGTGKTTMLGILSSFIGRGERVVTVEDAVELSLDLPNLVRLESRPANAEGAGEVGIRDLVRNALRMRPDRIVVGEVRGAEAIDMLQAMNTGHEGSLSTLHANTPRDALRRLETMVLLAGVDLPLRAIREQIASAIDVVVQLNRDAEGRRLVTSVTEVVGMEGDVLSAAEIFQRPPERGAELMATGVAGMRVTGAVRG
jgi:pilus assembly protein CpaF